jgi:methylenetetrahydrofolate reductase (NADPH)
MVDPLGDRPGAMKQAGIVYASDQIIDLVANGVKHIHVYTMNKPEIAAGILSNLSEIWK